VKLLVFPSCLILLLIGCMQVTRESSSTIENFNIEVKSVEVTPIVRPKKPNEVSIVINFVNKGETIDKWKFGFYMPGTSFCKLANDTQDINPNLVMEICNLDNKCATLQYDKATKITDKDLSQGYTNILSLPTNYPLMKNTSYRIMLSNNNFWGGGNLSYFPQNMFFLLPNLSKIGESSRVCKVLTELNTYKIHNYDYINTNKSIEQHIQNNWKKSIPFKRNIKITDIIPNPVKTMEIQGKTDILKNGIVIHNQLNHDNQIALIIKQALKNDFNIFSTIDNANEVKYGLIIKFLTNANVIKNNLEGYVLSINDNSIVIEALTNAGVYYAFQTLRQIWNNAVNLTNSHTPLLPLVSIIDYPRFKYRGMLLDTARHYFNITELMSLIDLMGIHKLNTLHLHLSDDEAFRVALPNYPTLSTIGSRRGLGLNIGPMMFLQSNLYENFGSGISAQPDSIYSGSYTASDVTSLIAYANANQITVIPEIDLPAHSRALIKSLPDQMIDPNDKSIFISAQGYTDNALPVCTYNTNISVGPSFTMVINDIITQIANLFNGQTTVYAIKNEISIGGDEVSPNAWSNNNSCQGAWRNLSALQKSHKFFQMLAEYNTSIFFSGWQQFVQTDNLSLGKTIVAPHRTGHIWVWSNSDLGTRQAIKLINNKYPTVLAFSDKTYFDLAYNPHLNEPGLNWASKYSDSEAALSSTISATNVIQGANTSAHKYLLGLEGALWSENVESQSQMLYMILPKMAGLAEASWSPSTTTHKGLKVNWQSLAYRLGCGQKGFLAYLSTLKITGYRGYPNGIKLEAPKGVCKLS
jgi:hexosaminidase